MPEPPSESSGQTQSIRRSVTLPTKLNPQAQRGSGAPNPGENVIFYHPTAKIVHFAPRALVPIPSSSAPADFDYPVDTIETLPWRSATERTVATAPLRLEKVHGLTVFLKCGNVVHAILKNSQCWCVDGVSKFVLRIRPLTYYRIEIPYETEQDQRLVEDLKAALPTALRYEVTPCPFKRAFTVEIPEDAMAPRRKRAWKPKRRLDDPITPSGGKGLSSDVKSECLDSASTGEDIDGAATDDSGLISQRVDSTTSAAVSAGDQSKASANSFDHPINPHPVRRSVTVTPQTFTSLRAKFDESPTRKQAPIREDQASETEAQESAQQSQVSNNTVVADIVADAHESRATHDRSVADDSQHQGNTTLEASAPAGSQLPRPATAEENKLTDVQSATGEVTDQQALVPEDIAVSNEASEQKAITSEDPVWVESNQVDASAQGFQSQGQLLSSHLDSTSTQSPVAQGDRPSETVSVSEQAAIEVPSVSMEASGGDLPKSEPDEDHDASFSSTPESFHSADLSSPDNSVSTRTIHEESPGMAQQINSVRELNSEAMAPSKSSEMSSPPKPSASNSHDIAVASPKFAYYETPRDSRKPSLAIPSETRGSSLPTPKAVSPTTDFNHMSSEFRRRSQATRQREVSPMPSPSAIYQPSPGEEATSIISKTLALVLVPPISLLIILLHITARIVISPALGSTSRESGKGPHTSTKEPVTEDDFSFPLEREASDRRDSEITRKLDPWDLD